MYLSDFFEILENFKGDELAVFDTVISQMDQILDILAKNEEFKQQVSSRNPYFLSIKQKMVNLCSKIIDFLIKDHGLDLENAENKSRLEQFANMVFRIAFLFKSLKLHLSIILRLKNCEKMSKLRIDIPKELESCNLASMKCFTIDKKGNSGPSYKIFNHESSKIDFDKDRISAFQYEDKLILHNYNWT
jgi:hypothetical protein